MWREFATMQKALECRLRDLGSSPSFAESMWIWTWQFEPHLENESIKWTRMIFKASSHLDIWLSYEIWVK